jgi:hypothetical protein
MTWRAKPSGDRPAILEPTIGNQASQVTDRKDLDPVLASEAMEEAIPEQSIPIDVSSDKSTLPPDTDDHIRLANDVAIGLIVADRKGEVRYGTRNYRKVQTAIKLLRRGADISEAARRAQLKPRTLEQLAQWGADRPGSFRSQELSARRAE